MDNLNKYRSILGLLILFIACESTTKLTDEDPMGRRIIVVNTQNVSSQDTLAFEANEMNYYSVIAKNAIAEGKLMGWYFYKMYESDNVDSVSNYLFVNTFESEEQLFENNWFDISEEKVNELQITNNPTEVNYLGSYFFELHSSLPRISEVKYTIFNFGYPNDSHAFLKEGEELFKPYFEKNMGERGLVGWGQASKLYSSNIDSTVLADQPTIMTADHYSNFRVAEMHVKGELFGTYDGFEEIMETTLFNFYMKNGWDSSNLYELISFVEAEN